MPPEGVRRFSRVSREAAVRDQADRELSEGIRQLSEGIRQLFERVDALDRRHEEAREAAGDDRERVDLVVDEAIRRAEAADGRLATELQRLADRVAALERRLGSAGPGDLA